MEFVKLKRAFDELKSVGEKQETRVHYHETRAHNIAMAYLIWERVFALGLYHYISNSHLNCSHSWILLGFSLSSTALYFLFFFEAAIMWYRAHNRLDIIYHKQIQLSQQIITILRTNNNATNEEEDIDHADFSMEAGNTISSTDGTLDFSFQVQELEYHPYNYKPFVPRKLYVASTLCALLSVAAFQLYMSHYSLCT